MTMQESTTMPAGHGKSGMPTKDVRRIGMLTPSSNTVLEPVTQQIVAGYGDRLSVHFARFPVTEISMRENAVAQFDIAPILTAAELLADARVNVIVWNGTSAGWLGAESDRRLCEAIIERTGITATTTMIAFEEVLEMRGIKRLGLVTPYLGEIQERIIANYRALDVETVAERHLEDAGNFSFCTYSPEYIGGLVREVAAEKPDAIFVICTNFRGAPVSALVEAETGIPIVDSVSVTVWNAMRLCRLDTSGVQGWGSVFEW